MVAVLEVDSEYFKERDYRLVIKSDDATFTHFVAKGHISNIFGRNYQFFPLTNHL